MITTKLHNPAIATGSVITNAVIEKVDAAGEKIFSDITASSPILPEAGRMWYNSETGSFKFVNVGKNGDNKVFVDEFLSKTDSRLQTIVGVTDFKNSVNVKNSAGLTFLTVDSTNKGVNLQNLTTFNLSAQDSVAQVTKTLKVTDSSNNSKIALDTVTDSAQVQFKTISANSQNLTLTTTSKFILSNGMIDKVNFDATTDTTTINMNNVNLVSNNVISTVETLVKVSKGTAEKLALDMSADELRASFKNVTVTGDTKIEGSLVVTGDMVIGGQTKKVNIQLETMNIADNVIVLNSNLKATDDPRLPSALVDGVDMDYNAGFCVNRGSQGTMDFLKWTESSDTTSAETLKEAVVKVAVWNYENDIPGYELNQIMDLYTSQRQVKDKSGTSKLGYDGQLGTHYTSNQAAGKVGDELTKSSFKLDAGKLDTSIDSIVQEIDAIKYTLFNMVRSGETTNSGKIFTITHGLGTNFVNVRLQVQRSDGSWMYDQLPVQIVDANTIKIESSETVKIRFTIVDSTGFTLTNDKIAVAVA